MVRCIGKELQQRKGEINKSVETVYFGGGTPSLLSEKELSFLMDSVKSYYRINKNVEITLEANPENIDNKKLELWKKHGINRLSIGLQSFKESDLKWMNRGHSVLDNTKAISLAQKAGYTSVSADLIYGLPGLSLNEWSRSVKEVVQSGVSHISAYCLTVEDKTKLLHDINKGSVLPLPEEKQVEQYRFLVSYLNKHGYEQYEVSNFAKEGAYSKHNTAYWKGKRYLGVGPSAHSFNKVQRRWNVANNSLYMKGVESGSSWFSEEVLNKNMHWNELFLTRLRTVWGVEKKDIVRLGGFTPKELGVLKKMTSSGLVKEGQDTISLSEEGFLFADSLSQSFFRVS